MRGHDIVSGKRIDPAIADRARQLRHEMTPVEQVLWQAVRANRLGGLHFRRQSALGGSTGSSSISTAMLLVSSSRSTDLSTASGWKPTMSATWS